MDDGYFWLTKEQFARLKPHLPRDTRGKPRVDDRRVISGIVHVLMSGCQWKDAPGVYGPRKTLYNRFQRWAAKGFWTNLFHALATAGDHPPRCSSTLLQSRRTDVLLAEKGGAQAGHWPLSWRTHDQDPCGGRSRSFISHSRQSKLWLPLRQHSNVGQKPVELFSNLAAGSFKTPFQ